MYVCMTLVPKPYTHAGRIDMWY